MPRLVKSLSYLLGASALAAPTAAVAGGWSPYIIGGVPAPEMESVGAFVHGDGWFCTGTVVASRVVLTAAHCLSDLRSPDDAAFFLGPDANDLSNGRTIALAELHVHPDYAQTDNADIAVAILAEDAGVTPIAVNLEPLGQDLVGQVLTFVGYGYSVQDVEGGDKRKVDITVSGLGDYFIEYATPGKNTCQGDSGGPAFLWDNGGSAWLLGVTSYGDAKCAVDGANTRTDVFASFVGAFLDGDWQGDPAVEDGGQIPIEPGTDPDDGVGDVDFCDFLGWYEDGVCDDCPSPDPDCEGEDFCEGAEDCEEYGDCEDYEDCEDDDYDDGCVGGGAGDLAAIVASALALAIRRRRDRGRSHARRAPGGDETG